MPNGVGHAVVGSRIDDFDSENMNGSRVVTGIQAGEVSIVSVYVAGPVDSAPHDKFELAIYTDAYGAPDRLLARADAGTLRADSWNSLPLRAALEARTAYWLMYTTNGWLMYTTNGTSGAVNNLTYTPVVVSSIDSMIRWQPTADGRRLADRVTSVEGNAPMAAATVALALYLALGRRRVRTALAMVASYVGALVVALILREAFFDPHGLYPSGHALRTTFLVVSLATVFPGDLLRAGGLVAVSVVSMCSIYGGGHYAEEIIGGVLLGGGMALLSGAFAITPRPRRSPAIDLRFVDDDVIDVRSGSSAAHPA